MSAVNSYSSNNFLSYANRGTILRYVRAIRSMHVSEEPSATMGAFIDLAFFLETGGAL